MTIIMMAGGRRNFDAAAASWDTNPYRVRLAQDVGRAFAGRVRLSPSMDVLEVGCGTGLVTLLLQPHVRSITGIDSSKGMLEVLGSRIQDMGLTNVTTRLIDLETCDNLEGTFDLVVSSMTLHHIRDVPRLLRQCFAVLKPGGTLAIADLDSDGGLFHRKNELVFHNGFDRAILSKEFYDTGLRTVRNRTAAMPVKPDCNGDLRCFSVFLITGEKPEEP